MISTSGIFSTGLKKCRPMNLPGSGTAFASPVIGNVDVFEAMTASAPTTCWAAEETLALRSRSSNTASMIRSQPARSASLSDGVIRANTSSRFKASICPRATFLSSNAAECALPFSAATRLTSLSTTSMPAEALTKAIPAPIIPAPSTPTLRVTYGAKPCGREPPALISLS
ncbi:hypothetical protein D3C78_1418370 [compost metagenome]